MEKAWIVCYGFEPRTLTSILVSIEIKRWYFKQKDSGSPLFYILEGVAYLVGINSVGNDPCVDDGENLAAVFSNVNFYRVWIPDNMWRKHVAIEIVLLMVKGSFTLSVFPAVDCDKQLHFCRDRKFSISALMQIHCRIRRQLWQVWITLSYDIDKVIKFVLIHYTMGK